MSEFLKKQFKKVKGLSYIISIPLEEFATLADLEEFTKEAKKNKVGIAIKYETSNFHCGVLVEIYDIDTCDVKEDL